MTQETRAETKRKRAEFKRTFFIPFMVNFVSGILSEVELNPTLTKKKKWQNPVMDSLKKKKKKRGRGRNKSSKIIFRVYCSLIWMFLQNKFCDLFWVVNSLVL